MMLQISNQLSSKGGLVTASDLRLYLRVNKDGKATELEVDPNTVIMQAVKDFSLEGDNFVVRKIWVNN
jgi:hypothetical protein